MLPMLMARKVASRFSGADRQAAHNVVVAICEEHRSSDRGTSDCMSSSFLESCLSALMFCT